MINYYEELELDKNLQGEELEKAFTQLTRQWINRTNAPDFDMKQEAERKVQLIQEAKEILLDGAKRLEYDKKLNIEEKKGNTKPTDSEEMPEELEIELMVIRKHIEENRPHDAIVLANKLITQYPNNVELWTALGDAHYEWGNFDVAEQSFLKVTHLDPDSFYAYYSLSFIYDQLYIKTDTRDRNLRKRYHNSGIEATRNALLINPNSYSTKIQWAIFIAREGRYDEAIEIYEKYVYDPDSGSTYNDLIRLAELYAKKGLSFLPVTKRGYYYYKNVDKSKKMIKYMKIANEIYENEDYHYYIEAGLSGIEQYKRENKKVFNLKSWPSFIIPILYLRNSQTLMFSLIWIFFIISIIYNNYKKRKDIMYLDNGFLNYLIVHPFVSVFEFFKFLFGSKFRYKLKGLLDKFKKYLEEDSG